MHFMVTQSVLAVSKAIEWLMSSAVEMRPIWLIAVTKDPGLDTARVNGTELVLYALVGQIIKCV